MTMTLIMGMATDCGWWWTMMMMRKTLMDYDDNDADDVD